MRCVIRSHHRNFKLPLPNEDLEQHGSLEPDPRYIRCCSAVCRPGYALRDALLGLLVLLGLSVIVTVIFVVCFYVVPDEKQLIEDGVLAGTAAGVIGQPNLDINEISLQKGDKYEVQTNDPLSTHPFGLDDTTGDYLDAPPGGNDYSSFQPEPTAEAEPRENLKSVLPEAPEESPQDHHGLLGHVGERPENLPPHDEHDHFHHGDEADMHHQHGETGHELPDSGNQDQLVPFQTEQSALTCRPIQLPMCVSSVPWSSAGVPNWMNHSSDEELFAILPYIKSELIDSSCSALSTLYACSILEPPCSDSQVLPPCRSFCAEVAQSCPGSNLPGLFNCERFPDSNDPNVCVSARQGNTPLPDTLLSTPSELVETFRNTVKVPTSSSLNRQTTKAESFTNLATEQMQGTFLAVTDSTDLDQTTMMSLADRLKFALSTSSKPRKPAQPKEKLRTTTQIFTAKPANKKTENFISGSGSSLADRIKSGATQRPRKIQTTRVPSQPFTFQQQTPPAKFTEPQVFIEEESSPEPSTGAMSLAELLAKRQTNKPRSDSRPQSSPQRTSVTSNKRNFSGQSPSLSSAFRHSSTSENRLKFTTTEGSTPSLSARSTSGSFTDEAERRIPVRRLDEMPRIRLLSNQKTSSDDNIRRPTTQRRVETTTTTEQPSLSRFQPRPTPLRPRPSFTTTTQSTTTPEVETPPTCPELQCLDGKCIRISQLNDGVVDCSDGSDEEDFGGLIT